MLLERREDYIGEIHDWLLLHTLRGDHNLRLVVAIDSNIFDNEKC